MPRRAPTTVQRVTEFFGHLKVIFLVCNDLKDTMELRCRFVEVMAPVFSREAWRCVWHMIQVGMCVTIKFECSRIKYIVSNF